MARRQSGDDDSGRSGSTGGSRRSTIRRSRHRQYGLSNANQVLLVLVTTALFFFALLRPHWLEFEDDISAGLWSFDVPAGVNSNANGSNSSVSVSWRAFCDPMKSNFMLPLAPEFAQPINLNTATVLCRVHAGGAYLSEIIRALVATAIGFCVLTLIFALYLHLGRPSRSQIFYFGSLPALALFIAGMFCRFLLFLTGKWLAGAQALMYFVEMLCLLAVLGTVTLILWQSYYGEFDNGDCFAVTIAATVIAYLVAFSMAIRWRWPGICAVPNEQLGFQSRAYRFGHQRNTTATAPPPAASHPLEGVMVDSNEMPPRTTTNFHQMRG